MATRSVLPNSSQRILQPMQGKHGTLQTRWIEALDSHVLFFNESAIASHHNGFSCHALAERILLVWDGKREHQHAMEQFDFILKCGGMGMSRDFVSEVFKGVL